MVNRTHDRREVIMDLDTNKITPKTYQKMNEEFIREGTPLRLLPTTQEQIDQRIQRDKDYYPKAVHNPPDTLRGGVV